MKLHVVYNAFYKKATPKCRDLLLETEFLRDSVETSLV